MGFATSRLVLLSFVLGVLFCSCCTYFTHVALSPLPVDGKCTLVMAVLGVGVAGAMISMYLYLWKIQDMEEVGTRVGTMKVALDTTDETGNNFSQSLATRKYPPLHVTVERDGRARLDMSFRKVTACTAYTLTGLKGPYRLVVSDGKIIVAERNGDFVTVRNLDGSIIKIIGVGKMEKPGGVALERGNIYVTSNHKLQKFSMDGELLKDIGSHEAGIENSEFNIPRGIVVNDQKVYVCDSLNDRIQVFDLNLTFIRNLISDVKDPQDIAFDRENNIYVSEKGLNRISVFNSRGRKLRHIGEPERGSTIRLNDPHGIHIYDKSILVSAESINGIMVYDTSGKYKTSITEFLHPRGIISDENGMIYICEFSKERIVVI